MLEKREVFLQSIKKVGPFTNRETGEIIEGFNAHYIDLSQNNDTESKGYIPSKKFLKVEEGQKLFNSGIGLYNLVLSLDLTSNRPRINVNGFEFIKKQDLEFN